MRKILFLVLLSPLLSTGQDRIVAFVGDKVILESEIKMRMERSESCFDEVLENLIEEKLLLIKAEKEKIVVEEEELKKEIERIKRKFPDEKSFFLSLKKEKLTYPEFKKLVERRIKIEKLIKSEIGEKIKISIFEITEELKKIKEYGKIKEVFLKGRAFESKEEAEEFIKEWDKEKYLEDIGWIKIDELLPQIKEKIEGLKEGQITEPVLVKKKYHVFLLKEIKKVQIPEEEMVEIARKNIYERKYKKLFKQFIENLKKEIPVRILK